MTEVTLPYEKEKRLPNAQTVFTVRVKDLPLIAELLERPMFDDGQETFSIRWVPRESLKDTTWEKTVENMEQRPGWDISLGQWDVSKGTEPKTSKHRA